MRKEWNLRRRITHKKGRKQYSFIIKRLKKYSPSHELRQKKYEKKKEGSGKKVEFEFRKKKYHSFVIEKSSKKYCLPVSVAKL